MSSAPVLAHGAAMPRHAPARSLAEASKVPLAILLVAALFFFCHPYGGIQGDATIYMMRALADLDPAGLGRDLMVVDDGQMRFSLFPSLLRPLVAAFGAAKAAMLVSAFASACWLAGLAALAWRLAPGRVALAMVAMVAVLPVSYGDNAIFAFGEVSATPRPLAEALVMAGLAALLAGRLALAMLALAVAALIHPLMAAAGLGVAALIGAWRLPRAWRLALLGLAAVAALAALGLGVLGIAPFDRLVVRPDPDWLALLRLRSPHLFPTSWTSATYPPLLAQAATIVIAAHRAAPAQRRLYVATLAVCVAGLAAEALLGDTLNLLVFVQTQAWRATWLVGVVGGCALAFCTATLWRDGPRGRIVLALLTLAWFYQPTPLLTVAVVGLAVVLEVGSAGARLPLTARHVVLVYCAVAVLTLDWASGPILGYVAHLRGLPPDEPASLIDPLRNNLQTLPLCVLIAAWLVAPAAFERGTTLVISAVAALGLVVATMLAWDQRGVAQSYLESPHAPTGLSALAAGCNQEVLWIGDRSNAWFALRRPQYFSTQQGVSIVFSRRLAAKWVRRANVLIALGLAPRSVYAPWKPAADDDHERVTQAAVDAFCARPDAPGLVVFPRVGDAPSLRGMIVWPLPAPFFRTEPHVSSDELRRADSYGVVPCAPRIAR